MLSIGKIAAGTGHKYLSRDLKYAAGEYYIGPGVSAPTAWLGRGAPLLGLHGEVEERDMAALYGQGVDRRTGQALGRAWRVPTLSDDPHEREDQLRLRVLDAYVRAERVRGRDLYPEERLAIEQKIRGRHEHATVAGFDLTFSPPKSVSVLFAGLDATGQAEVRSAVDVATRMVIEHLEREAGGTRAGANGVRRLDSDGWTVAAFEHHTSRAGDIQMHRHLAVLNKVRTTVDGEWRALDSATIYKSAAAAGTVGQRVLEAELTRRLNVRWTADHEVDGIPASVLRNQSKRRSSIEAALQDRSIDHSDGPMSWTQRSNNAEQAQLVTLATRDKKVRGERLGDVLGRIRDEVRSECGIDLTVLAAAVTNNPALAAPTPTSVADRAVMAEAALTLAQRRRSVFTRSDVVRAAAEVVASDAPALAAHQVASLVDEVAALAIVEAGVLRVNAPALYHVDPNLRRSDGRTVFENARAVDRYTTRAMLDTEERILHAARAGTGPTLPADMVEAHIAATLGDQQSASQAAAVRAITTWGRQLVVIEGPAGTGKSRMMREVAHLWQSTGRQVVGLALSQNAANVLASEASIRCENTAKYLHELGRHTKRMVDAETLNIKPETRQRWTIEADQWRLQPGALMILDEASMAANIDIDLVLNEVARVGGQLVLVGDPYQLGAVDAGGALALVINDVGAVTLDTVRRQRAQWERDATLSIRAGRAGILNEYLTRDRVRGGTRDEMLAGCYRNWLSSRILGEQALMVVSTNSEAGELSRQARAQLVAWGNVETVGTPLADGNIAGVGDIIATRRNARDTLDDSGRFVANRDVWRVLTRTGDGTLTVARYDTGELATLTADYLAEHGELGYASTIHGAQGRTVDACYALVDDHTTREALYVAMSRGTRHNHVFVVATVDPEHADLEHHQLRAVLADALQRTNAAESATLTVRHELAHTQSLASMYPVWADCATRAANIETRQQLANQLGAVDAELVVADPNYPRLQRAIWQATTLGHTVHDTLTHATATPLGDAAAPVAVLEWRINTRPTDPATTGPVGWAERTLNTGTPDANTARAVAAAIDNRISELADAMRVLVADRQLPPWATEHLVIDQHTDPANLVEVLTRIAVYREAFAVADQIPLTGAPPASTDPVRNTLHADAGRDIGPHLKLRRLGERELADTITQTRAVIDAEPDDVRPQLAAAHRALHVARDSGDTTATAASDAAVAVLETSAQRRAEWWTRAQPALITNSHARRETDRRTTLTPAADTRRVRRRPVEQQPPMRR